MLAMSADLLERGTQWRVIATTDAVHKIGDGISCNPEVRSNGLMGLSGRHTCPYSLDLGWADLVPSRPSDVKTALLGRVLHVLERCPKKEMVGPNAERSITAMENADSTNRDRWQLPVLERPSNDVGAASTAHVVDLAVGFSGALRFMLSCRPEPATRPLLDARPKAARSATEPAPTTYRTPTARTASSLFPVVTGTLLMRL